jgi:hypothetical protein
MKDNIRTLLELFNNLNYEEKLILYNHVNNTIYNIKQKQTQEDLVIDYDQIMSLSWF